ncbi:DUF6252 family protein [Confluentibacter sediminis]|uniref:DUF6252 family protein n=1 Tax=Confluentibacter sediminis TaxID=2219045 RepID=UPI000DAE45BF|nr:DUF6252 family protein [Confluentibacter sediminis]
MKKLKQLILLFTASCLLLVTFYSCSSNDDGGSNGAAGEGTIVAKIEGDTFTSMKITSFASVVTGGAQTTLTMQGNTSSQAINMIINGYEGVGTYQLSDSNVFVIASYMEPNINDPLNSQTWSAPYQDSGVVGEIKISEETDTNVIGTFQFTCKNSNDDSTKSVTEGSFNLVKQSF